MQEPKNPSWMRKKKLRMLLSSECRAYPALLKYTQKASDVNRLNKNEVCAIAFRFFGTMLKEADKKEILVAKPCSR